MRTIAFATLGCKVNQYDTQAMLEQFTALGYETVGFEDEADVYVINTCTVTGTSDAKSRKLIRRAARRGEVIVTGCMAQKDGQAIDLEGVRLVVGMRHRGEVAALFEKAVKEDRRIVAVEALEKAPFLPLTVSAHEGKTRAVLKIQEGCDRKCSYCIIPSVRGPVRSMPLDALKHQAAALADAGYREIVLTGIHLMSYGRDLEGGLSLPDAVRAVAAHVPRVRLGSLEPPVSDEVLEALAAIPELCPQFHVALQSGSASVLRRMRRGYTPEAFAETIARIRALFENPAITTDIITGFCGETDEEHAQTTAFVEKIGFAHLHVFPYSPRAGTEAAQMDDQVAPSVKTARTAALIDVGQAMQKAYEASLIGTVQAVLVENAADGRCLGLTPQHVRVCFESAAQQGETVEVLISAPML